MKVLAIDLSTKTGFAFLSSKTLGELPAVDSYGVFQIEKGMKEVGDYPYGWIEAIDRYIYALIKKLVLENSGLPDIIIIEETNKSSKSSRYVQKILEWLHLRFLVNVKIVFKNSHIGYISSSEWRSKLNMKLSNKDKKANSTLRKESKKAKSKGTRVNKKTLGIGGLITKKHLSVRWVNENYNLSLKQKDNDIADAIMLGASYFMGAKLCDGE